MAQTAVMKGVELTRQFEEEPGVPVASRGCAGEPNLPCEPLRRWSLRRAERWCSRCHRRITRSVSSSIVLVIGGFLPRGAELPANRRKRQFQEMPHRHTAADVRHLERDVLGYAGR